MDVAFLLALVALAVADHGSSSQPVCTLSEEMLCLNFRLPDGTLAAGHLDNTGHTLNRITNIFSDRNLCIDNCVAPIVYKDPCSSSPCNISEQGEACYREPYNIGYDCDCFLGFYGVDCGYTWAIGLVDRYKTLSVIILPYFKQQNRTTIYQSPRLSGDTLPIPAYDPTDGLFYFVGNEIIYRGRLGDDHMQPIRNLSGYTESAKFSSKMGGGLMIDYDFGWLYVGHKIEGAIKRYPIPSLDLEEIFFRPNDKSTWEGVSALGISRIKRLLYWIDFKGIVRCSLDICFPMRIYHYSKEVLFYSIDSYHLAVDDASAKIFWNERTILGMSIIKMAELDGTLVDQIWEEKSVYPYLISHSGWLVRYDLESLNFWYARILDYVSSSRRRSRRDWAWKSTLVPKFYAVSSMFSV